jgi:hypothetical protein
MRPSASASARRKTLLPAPGGDSSSVKRRWGGRGGGAQARRGLGLAGGARVKGQRLGPSPRRPALLAPPSAHRLDDAARVVDDSEVHQRRGQPQAALRAGGARSREAVQTRPKGGPHNPSHQGRRLQAEGRSQRNRPPPSSDPAATLMGLMTELSTVEISGLPWVARAVTVRWLRRRAGGQGAVWRGGARARGPLARPPRPSSPPPPRRGLTCSAPPPWGA